MMTIAGGIILAVVLLWVGGMALMLLLATLAKMCDAWGSATLRKRNRPVRPASYPNFSYTTNTGGFDVSFRD
jgi:hypothetical protein